MADPKLLDQVCRDYIALQGHSWKVLFRGMDKWSEVLKTMVTVEIRELYRKRAARMEYLYGQQMPASAFINLAQNVSVKQSLGVN